mgnify:CR=1 FL=1
MKKILLDITLLLTLTACNENFYNLPPEPIIYPSTSSSQRVEVESNSGPARPYISSGQVVR